LRCGSDRKVDGDLNSGMVRFDILPSYELYYCIHEPYTSGGTQRVLTPGEGWSRYPFPASGLLRDIQFLAWDPGSLPSCSTTDCVDTSPLGAFAFLEVADTFDSYCQRYFGPDYHPMLRPWESHSWNGTGSNSVPDDAEAWDLNAGVLGSTIIYGCVAYTGTTVDSITMTTPPAHVGQLVDLKAMVDPTDGGGTVRFTSDGMTIPGCEALGFGSGGGTTWQAICSTRSLPPGTHTITAQYSGDGDYASSSGTGEQTINVTPPSFVVRLYSGTNRALTLGVAGASTAPGARIVQQPSKGKPYDVWAFKAVGNNFEIVNMNSNLCLTTDGVAGDTIYQTPCIAVPSQLWQLPPDFGSKNSAWIRNPATNLYVNVHDGSSADGTAIDLWAGKAGQAAQSFFPVPA
jgi:Bacterial Ig-like domain (group 3)/Ricin-type beta-trefoil lectin domain-like